MGKYADLIAGLGNDATFHRSFRALVRADHRAFRPLVTALLSHPDADVREGCAEILGERCSTAAIPFLIDALRDTSEFVRHDARLAIEHVCRMEPGALADWLDASVFADDPNEVCKKMKRWWRLNKRYIENNLNFDRFS